MTDMPDAAIAEIARHQHGLITLEQARTCELSPQLVHYRVTQGRWERVGPQVYRIAGCPETWHQRLLAATFLHGAVASHRSALKLHGIMGYRTEVVEVSARPRRRRRLDDVTCHETVCFSGIDHTLVDAIPVTTVERTLIDIGAVHSPRFVEDVLDEALRRNLTTLDAVIDRVHATRGQGRNGVGVMRAIVEQRDPRASLTESVLESRFLRALRACDVPLPEPQHTIRLGHHVVARVDFAYPEHHLAVEIDGLRYHASRQSLEADARRQNEIILAGYRILRFTAADLESPDLLAQRMLRALRETSAVA